MSALRMENATIRNLIRTVIAIMSATLVGFMVLTWVKSDDLTHRTRELQNIRDAMRVMADARFRVSEIRQRLTAAGVSGDKDAIADAEKELAGAMESLDRLETLMPEDRQVEKFREGVRELHEIGMRMANAYAESGRRAGNAVMKGGNGGFDVRFQQLNGAMSAFITSLDRSFDAATVALNEDERSSRLMIIGLGAAVLVFLAMAGGILFAKVIPPLNRLLASLRDMNNGSADLTRRLPLQGRDEVGEIVEEFNRFLGQLQALASDVSRSSTQLHRTASGMLGVISEAERGMLKQQGEVMHVVTAMNEMSTTVQEIARNAARAAEAAEQADKEALQSKQVVSLTKTTIGALAEEVEKATRVIHQLETESDNIGIILDVIRDIADQTNLLALNAAIEAARAGEQGRGFAVVADEVRSLASRTQDSTQQIKTMIERLQAGANNAVKVMESGRAQAQRSVQQAADAEGSLQAITAAVGTINEMNMQIASAAEEQSAVSAEINRNVHNISEVTEEAAKGVKQSTDLCGDVMEESRQLQAQISKFRV